jgi:hypothetical protein
MRHAGPPWILSASFNTRLSAAPWLRSSPQSSYSPWASANASGSPAIPSTWAEWSAREDEASARCPQPPATMWPSRRLTRAPSWDSGESVGKLAH